MWFVVEFSIVAALTIFAAWAPVNRKFKRVLAMLQFKRVSTFYLVAWILMAATFSFFFAHSPQRWELLCLVTEMAGVTYLAREVNHAQDYESIKNELERLQELGPICDPKEYFRRHNRIGKGVPENKVEAAIQLAETKGTLDQEVLDLKLEVAEKMEEMKGETTDLLSKRRKRLLVLGLCLVVLALWGHALLASDPDRRPEASATDAVSGSPLDALMRKIERDEVQQNLLIAALETQLADQKRILDSVTQENRRWHVHRARSKKCPASGSSPCCVAAPSPSQRTR